jgi:hypothetical protein
MSFPENTAALADDEPLQLIDADGMRRDLDFECTRSVKRLAKTDPDFPPIVRFNGRFITVRSQWQAYKARLIERGLAAQPAKTFPTRKEVQS